MNLLCFDHRPLLRSGIASLLRLSDPTHTVHERDSIASCLELLDDVLLDAIVLCVFDETESTISDLRMVLGTGLDVPVCVIAERLPSEDASNLISHGARGVVSLSSTPEQLLSALEVIVQGGIAMQGDIKTAVPEFDSNLSEHAVVTPICSSQAGEPGDVLSRRQQEVLELLVLGESNKAISKRMCISENTVKTHVAAILRHFGVRNRTEAALRFTASENDFLRTGTQ